MAVIKQQPEDFIVKELQSRRFREHGKYVYFWMTKRNLTTLQACEEIASELKIPLKRISVAGNKDKIALTTQLIAMENVERARAERLLFPRIQLTYAGHDDRPLRLGDLDGNHFEIVVRDVAGPQKKLIHLFPNFYGPQRFSLNNARIGECIIREEFSKAIELMIESNSDYSGLMKDFLAAQPKNKVGALKLVPRHLLKLYVHSFQSVLWNEVLEQLLKSRSPQDIAGLQIPVPGFSLESSSDIERAMQHVLACHKVSPRNFILRNFPEISLEGDARSAVARIGNLKMSSVQEPDGKYTVHLEFDLQKGSYATVAVRYLVDDLVEERKSAGREVT